MTPRKKKVVSEGHFEILLREFMAGSMSSKEGNRKINELRKKAFFRGFSRMCNRKLINPFNLVGSKYAWYIYQKERP